MFSVEFFVFKKYLDNLIRCTFQIECDWQCYLDRYKDLQYHYGPNNLDGAETHWNTYGKTEGRDCTCGNISANIDIQGIMKFEFNIILVDI